MEPTIKYTEDERVALNALTELSAGGVFPIQLPSKAPVKRAAKWGDYNIKHDFLTLQPQAVALETGRIGVHIVDIDLPDWHRAEPPPPEVADLWERVGITHKPLAGNDLADWQLRQRALVVQSLGEPDDECQTISGGLHLFYKCSPPRRSGASHWFDEPSLRLNEARDRWTAEERKLVKKAHGGEVRGYRSYIGLYAPLALYAAAQCSPRDTDPYGWAESTAAPQAAPVAQSAPRTQGRGEYPTWTTELIDSFLASVSSSTDMKSWVAILKAVYEAATNEAGWTHDEAISELDKWSRESAQYKAWDRPEKVFERIEKRGEKLKENGSALTGLAKKYGAEYPRGGTTTSNGRAEPPPPWVGSEPPPLEDEQDPAEVADKSDERDAPPKRESRANRFRKLTEQIVQEHPTEFMVCGEDTYIADERGLWHTVDTRRGRRQIYRLLTEADAQALVTGRDTADVAATLQVRVEGLNEVMPTQLNRQRLLLGADTIFDALTRQELEKDAVRESLSTWRQPGTYQHHGERSTFLLEQLMGYFGEELRAVRYAVRHRVLVLGKHIPVGWSKASSTGKDLVFLLAQLLWGR